MSVLVRLAVWFLNRKNITVLLNVDITGDVEQKCRKAYMENMSINGHVYDSGGAEFRVPNGKFHVEYNRKSN